MTKLAKVVAWFSLVYGALTLLAPLLIYALRHQLIPLTILTIWLVLGLGSLLGGYHGLKSKPWAFMGLTLLYFIQSADYFSPTAFVNFMGPIAFKIGWGWYSPPIRISINLLAIAFTVLSFVSAMGLASRPGGDPADPA